ncbi:MAG: DUF389 domain-containing protein [Thermodesulfobacteriota bacterium]
MFTSKLKGLRINWIKTSPERRVFVVAEVSSGSEPGIRFYLLLTTSALIAAFGLIANSTAVIIGAMLVSPLMTPIIGSSLGLVIGDGRLFANSLRSVVIGTVLAILFSSLLGFLPLALEATPEMLLRVRPTLLDLLVAVLAGFAGAYAMIDEKVSPALPGVAIAVAIVPRYQIPVFASRWVTTRGLSALLCSFSQISFPSCLLLQLLLLQPVCPPQLVLKKTRIL